MVPEEIFVAKYVLNGLILFLGLPVICYKHHFPPITDNLNKIFKRHPSKLKNTVTQITNRFPLFPGCKAQLRFLVPPLQLGEA